MIHPLDQATVDLLADFEEASDDELRAEVQRLTDHARHFRAVGAVWAAELAAGMARIATGVLERRTDATWDRFLDSED